MAQRNIDMHSSIRSFGPWMFCFSVQTACCRNHKKAMNPCDHLGRCSIKHHQEHLMNMELMERLA